MQTLPYFGTPALRKDLVSTSFSRRKFIGRLVSGVATVAGVAGGGWLAGSGTSRATACLRPPGALSEQEFLATCIRCGRCADACPNRCITAFTEETAREVALAPGPGQRATPVIFPRRQACMLCNGVPGKYLLCTDACPSGALQPTRKDRQLLQAHVKMGTAEVDRNICYSFHGASCGACVRACPFEGQALRAGLWEKPIIDPEACIGCGLCERSCLHYPQAIRVRPSMSRV